MRKPFLSIILLFFTCLIKAQNSNQAVHRLKVFIDCSSGCDHTFIRTEINIVDFLLDNKAADVHVLITEQSTGSGGSQYQLIFFGQNRFKFLSDTLRFNTDPNATDFEERDLLVKYIKLGLTPYIIKAGGGNDIAIEMKKAGGKKQDSINVVTKDPWNYWVFRAGISGSANAEELTQESSYNGQLSATRVTEELKIGIELNSGKNKAVSEYEDSTGYTIKDISRNDYYNFSHHLIKSINDHWSWGYEAALSRNTRSNYKRQAILRTGIEYNIFPYKQVNTKYFTIAYILDLRHNSYIDTTLYDKAGETLAGHGVETNLAFNQKWGTIEFGVDYHNYFHNWKLLNLEAYLELEIRVTGGLSFTVFTFAELLRDQIYLSKHEASFVDILTRRRELESGYRFGTHFGINYRFGSKLNNFVNPRFGRD